MIISSWYRAPKDAFDGSFLNHGGDLRFSSRDCSCYYRVLYLNDETNASAEILARERTRVLVSPRMTYGPRQAKPPLYLDSKVRAQRAFCYDINCRLSCANYLSICILAVPSIVIVDFATPKPDPPAKCTYNPYEIRAIFYVVVVPRGFHRYSLK